MGYRYTILLGSSNLVSLVVLPVEPFHEDCSLLRSDLQSTRLLYMFRMNILTPSSGYGNMENTGYIETHIHIGLHGVTSQYVVLFIN
jgi:hypothetical protein